MTPIGGGGMEEGRMREGDGGNVGRERKGQGERQRDRERGGDGFDVSGIGILS